MTFSIIIILINILYQTNNMQFINIIYEFTVLKNYGKINYFLTLKYMLKESRDVKHNDA